MHKYILAIFLLTASLGLNAGNAPDELVANASIEGTIKDASSNETLSGVAIKIDGLNYTVYTDFDGNFKIDKLIPGKYDITVSMPSYKIIKIEKVEVDPMNSRKLKLKMSTLF